MKALIVGNGSLENIDLLKKEAKKADFIICADGGAGFLEKASLLPHFLIGDFDSIDQGLLDFYRSKNIEIIQHPTKKDFTDTELAIELALEKKARAISLIAVTGSRIDHSLSSLFLLKPLIEKKIDAKILSDCNEVYLLGPGESSIKLEKKNLSLNMDELILSLLALSEKVEGIRTTGLSYPLVDACLKQGSSLGVSNRFSAPSATIRIKKGFLYIILSKEI